MTDEGRRTVKMDAILSLIAGQGGEGVTDLLCFLTKRDVAPQEEAVVETLCTGWLCSQIPSLLDKPFKEGEIYSDWAGSQIKRLGDNVTLPPLPEGELAKVTSLLDTLAAQKAQVYEATTAASDLEAKVAELEPFKAKAAEMEKKAEGLADKVKDLEGQIKELKAKAAEFEGKLAVDEKDINDTIKSIVSTALKSLAAAAPAAGGEAGGEAAAEAPAEEGGVPDTFGFGSSGDDSDGFGF